MTRTAVHVFPDRHPVVGNLNPSGHLSVTIASNATVGSDDPATMHALADAFRTAAKKLEDHLLAADKAAARAVNANRNAEPFGSLPDRMPARVPALAPVAASPAPAATPQLQTLAHEAARLGVSIRTLRRRIADGSLTAYRVGPQLIRLDPAEVDALLNPIASDGAA